jgi:D-3-phosphoglycerate dehydrogenase
MKVLVATSPFSQTDPVPLQLLEKLGVDIVLNPYHRRLRESDVTELLQGVDAVIAGTEPYNAKTLANADRLKVISRVGIGLDSVDLAYCHDHNITVTYTPDAPSDAVAELALANIINLARSVVASDRSVRDRTWNRHMGRLVRELTIGVLGVGRIGSRVIGLLQPFQPTILACDQDPNALAGVDGMVTPVSLEELLTQSDILTLHIPMNEANRCLVNSARISQMKPGAMLINTSRGGIVDEQALVDALQRKHLAGAALDVFADEPYHGPLASMDHVLLTAHIGASARESRRRMELGAAEDCIAVLTGQPPANLAPLT